MAAKIDAYMSQEELKLMWEIRDKAFARVTLETANELVEILPDGDAREIAKRLSEVATQQVEAHANSYFLRVS